MDRLLGWMGMPPHADLSMAGQLLALIIGATLALFALAIVFAMVVVALRMRHVAARRRRDRLEARWRGPMLEVLSGLQSPAVMHAQLRPGEELDLLAFLVPLARRVRGAEAGLLRQVAAPALPRLARELSSASPERRALAVEMLALLGAREDIPSVVRALDDASPYVAMTAAHALATPEHAAHAESVVRRIRRFSRWSASYVSAMLARIGDAVVPATRGVLADAGEPITARAVAAAVLARRNDPGAADIAARILGSGDTDPAASSTVFQQAALTLLAQVGRAEHRPVIRMLVSASDPAARAAAVRALSAVGEGADGEVLVAAMGDRSTHVAQEAARGLVRLGRADLLESVAHDGGGAGLAARQALGEAGS